MILGIGRNVTGHALRIGGLHCLGSSRHPDGDYDTGFRRRVQRQNGEIIRAIAAPALMVTRRIGLW